ncbi:hypothetical protein [Variovorax sp. OV329]|uniref:hypothetical protein n=1 Tax=Variovorax sp. OV329 TaxID=1882825 RepID=UPI0015871CB4|nr:hypothetical protein [Variovorax sp. OV329]
MSSNIIRRADGLMVVRLPGGGIELVSQDRPDIAKRLATGVLPPQNRAARPMRRSGFTAREVDALADRMRPLLRPMLERLQTLEAAASKPKPSACREVVEARACAALARATVALRRA